jgi:hypothetical protein
MLEMSSDFELDVGQELDVDLSIRGGASSDLFPSVTKWFFESTAHRNAFSFVMPKTQMSNYESLVDCLVCEVFKDLKPWCFRFYRREGPHLSKLISREDQVRMEGVLLQSLAYASILEQANRQSVKLPDSWVDFNFKAKTAIFGRSNVGG